MRTMGKIAGGWGLSVPSNQCPGLEWVELYLPSTSWSLRRVRENISFLAFVCECMNVYVRRVLWWWGSHSAFGNTEIISLYLSKIEPPVSVGGQYRVYISRVIVNVRHWWANNWKEKDEMVTDGKLSPYSLSSINSKLAALLLNLRLGCSEAGNFWNSSTKEKLWNFNFWSFDF